MKRNIVWSAAALVVVIAMPAFAQQAYPAKTVRMILPFAPGGPSDIIGRALSAKLTEQMGQQVVADNRPGAGGNLGMELGAKAPPDGYTITLTSPTMAISPSLYKKLAFDPQKDFAPIGLVANIPNIMVVHLSVPVKTLKEFIQVARTSPGKLNYGSSGAGSTTHLSSEILSSIAGLKMVHVPYKGQSLALVGLLSGQVDMMILAVPTVLPMIQSNKVRAIAALSPKRLPTVPQVPTTSEAGVKDFEVSVWFGMLAPGGTPPAIVNRLNQELTKAVTSPDIRDRFAGGGIEPMTSTPEQFAAYARAETARYAKVIRDANISID
jgi:tripartite-type tricarboxylate transporter receptor subunit TctC